MNLGEKLLALTLEYRDAIENPVTLEGFGIAYEGRSAEAIGVDYEATLRELLT